MLIRKAKQLANFHWNTSVEDTVTILSGPGSFMCSCKCIWSNFIVFRDCLRLSKREVFHKLMLDGFLILDINFCSIFRDKISGFDVDNCEGDMFDSIWNCLLYFNRLSTRTSDNIRTEGQNSITEEFCFAAGTKKQLTLRDLREEWCTTVNRFPGMLRDSLMDVLFWKCFVLKKKKTAPNSDNGSDSYSFLLSRRLQCYGETLDEERGSLNILFWAFRDRIFPHLWEFALIWEQRLNRP